MRLYLDILRVVCRSQDTIINQLVIRPDWLASPLIEWLASFADRYSRWWSQNIPNREISSPTDTTETDVQNPKHGTFTKPFSLFWTSCSIIISVSLPAWCFPEVQKLKLESWHGKMGGSLWMVQQLILSSHMIQHVSWKEDRTQLYGLKKTGFSAIDVLDIQWFEIHRNPRSSTRTRSYIIVPCPSFGMSLSDSSRRWEKSWESRNSTCTRSAQVGMGQNGQSFATKKNSDPVNWQSSKG